MAINEVELEEGIRNAKCARREMMWQRCLTVKE
jgi:hypothetical protein